MNWLRWVICWWHGDHVPIRFHDKQGRAHNQCVRCGGKL